MSGRHSVLVSLESTAAHYLGLDGALPDVMPNLTTLAQSGLVFDRAFSAYPESIKGLYSVICSAYPAFDVPAGAYGSYEENIHVPLLVAAPGLIPRQEHSQRVVSLGRSTRVSRCCWTDSERSSLFDLDTDPGERGDVAVQHPDRVRWYVENLKSWSAAQKRRF